MLFGASMWGKALREQDFRLTSQTFRQITTKTLSKLAKLNFKGEDGSGL